MKQSAVNLDIELNHQVVNIKDNLVVRVLHNKKIVTEVDVDTVLDNSIDLWIDEPEVLLEMLYSLKKSLVQVGGQVWIKIKCNQWPF